MPLDPDNDRKPNVENRKRKRGTSELENRELDKENDQNAGNRQVLKRAKKENDPNARNQQALKNAKPEPDFYERILQPTQSGRQPKPSWRLNANEYDLASPKTKSREFSNLNFLSDQKGQVNVEAVEGKDELGLTELLTSKFDDVLSPSDVTSEESESGSPILHRSDRRLPYGLHERECACCGWDRRGNLRLCIRLLTRQCCGWRR